MEPTLTLKDVVNFLELGKKRAELSFRIEISKDEDKAQYSEKLKSIQEGLDVLSERLEKAGITIPTPFESRIASLNESLSEVSATQIHDAMKNREGELFQKLAQRGAITKKNFENRENIAKLSLLLPKIEKDVREKILDSIKHGSIQDAIPMLNTNQNISSKIAAILGRIGLKCRIEEGSLIASQEANEVEVEVQNKKVWVAHGLHEKLNKNKESLYNISSKIQLKNAVRQIKQFTEEEEKEFAAMQNEYLKLLKEQDELLKDFLDEEKIMFSD
jgi:hypothetical protein